MVHSNGIREPATTLLSTDLAVTSWKVTPANSGVDTERTSPIRGSSASVAGDGRGRPRRRAPVARVPVFEGSAPGAGLSACASHLMATFEYMF